MSLPNGAEESLTLTSQLSQQKLKISVVADRRYRRKVDPLRAEGSRLKQSAALFQGVRRHLLFELVRFCAV